MILLSRRKLLVFCGALLLPSCSRDKQDSINPRLAKLLDELSMRAWSVQMGKELYNATPKQFNSASINELFDQNFSLPMFSDDDKFKKAVRTEISKDFRHNRLTIYQSWIFSQKESVLYVLAFLFTNLKSDVI
jgi:hypothetical protein